MFKTSCIIATKESRERKEDAATGIFLKTDLKAEG